MEQRQTVGAGFRVSLLALALIALMTIVMTGWCLFQPVTQPEPRTVEESVRMAIAIRSPG